MFFTPILSDVGCKVKHNLRIMQISLGKHENRGADCCAPTKFILISKLFLKLRVMSYIIKSQQEHKNHRPRKRGKSYVKQIHGIRQTDCRSRNQDHRRKSLLQVHDCLRTCQTQRRSSVRVSSPMMMRTALLRSVILRSSTAVFPVII